MGIGMGMGMDMSIGMGIGTGTGTGTGTGVGTGTGEGEGVPSQYLAQEPAYLSMMPQPTVYCSVGAWKYLVRGRTGVL